jgi:hypothetical protein
MIPAKRMRASLEAVDSSRPKIFAVEGPVLGEPEGNELGGPEGTMLGNPEGTELGDSEGIWLAEGTKDGAALVEGA